MAIPYVTGPVHIYVGTGGAPPRNPASPGTPVYLGSAEVAPRIRLNPQWVPVNNDAAGARLPYDVIWSGEDGTISGALTVWNWAVYAACRRRPNNAGTIGFNAVGDVGTLMVTEGMAYPLWLHFPYFTKFSGAGMPAGRRFLACWLLGPDEEEPGTGVNRVHFTFQAHRWYDPSTGTFTLYDENMSGIPAVPPATALGV